MPKLTPEQAERERVERYAIRCALGNNGGKWSEHYTDDQKQHWRRFVEDLSLDIWKEAYDAGYEKALKDADG